MLRLEEIIDCCQHADSEEHQMWRYALPPRVIVCRRGPTHCGRCLEPCGRLIATPGITDAQSIFEPGANV